MVRIKKDGKPWKQQTPKDERDESIGMTRAMDRIYESPTRGPKQRRQDSENGHDADGSTWGKKAREREELLHSEGLTDWDRPPKGSVEVQPTKNDEHLFVDTGDEILHFKSAGGKKKKWKLFRRGIKLRKR